MYIKSHSMYRIYSTCISKGVRQPLKKDDFSELLNVQGFSKPDKTPKTLKDMKKENDIEGAIDPERARVIIHAHKSHTLVAHSRTGFTKDCGLHVCIIVLHMHASRHICNLYT